MKNYNSVFLEEVDYQVLSNIEKIIQKSIPFKNYKSPITYSLEFGFHAENGKIDILIVFNKKFKKFPSSIFSLDNLKVLEFSCENQSFNDLNIELPEEILRLQKLKTLNLNHNGLKNLPESLYELSSLEYLLLEANGLTKISDNIGNLKNLKTLHLRANNLKNLPDSLWELKNLEEFYIGTNNIKVIPKEIENLQSLKYLSLKNNLISFIPEEIGKLTSLECLDLEAIHTTNFPETFLNLRNLRELQVLLEYRISQKIKNLLKKLKDRGVVIYYKVKSK